VSKDTEIAALYQLPLDEFTAARNALAKTSGKDAATIRALSKPPVAAWAVNQLYWKTRRTWDALVDAAENLRRVNKAVLGGRAGDVRTAGQVHDEAVQDALKATLALLTDAGHPVTDGTKQAILNTLRALPGDDPPGRLTRVLQPGGFEMLAGLSLAKNSKDAKEPRGTKPPKEPSESVQSKADAKALTQAREAAASADRALKDAEQAVRRHEFEIARATRDEERGARGVEQAHATLAEAKNGLAAAERDRDEAVSRREAAEAAAQKAVAAVTTARRQAEAAAAALKKIQSSV
jgi:hypothetical protein